MDIAKYIGLFLLKNKSCYIHGLGNLELSRKPATYVNKTLVSGAYEVNVVPAGTIDESLANFIANTEQISISKATAALKGFSAETKKQIEAGQYVHIPAFGKFAETNGKLQFITSPQLQFAPAPIPAERVAPRRTDNTPAAAPSQPVAAPIPTPPAIDTSSPFDDESEGTRLNWPRILLVLALLVATAAIAIFGYRYVKNRSKNNAPIVNQDSIATVTATPSIDEGTVMDTTQAESIAVKDSVSPAIQPANGALVNFKVILNVYDERAKAEKRLQRLRSFGNKVDLIAEDSNTYFIIMPVSAPAKDTSRILDSLERNFNPDGISIY